MIVPMFTMACLHLLITWPAASMTEERAAQPVPFPSTAPPACAMLFRASLRLPKAGDRQEMTSKKTATAATESSENQSL